MKAGIYLGKEQVVLRELPLPTIGDDDVLVQNLYSGICGTDAAVYQRGPNTGHRVAVGGEFGHETVSRVVKVGKNVTAFRVGQRVYPYPLLAKDDPKRAGTLGAFSEYMRIPRAQREHALFAVDNRISDRLACLIEPFTVGCRAARRGMIPCGLGRYVTGQKAVVFGSGTIGLAAAVALQYLGMDRVMVCDCSDYRLQLAKELGFAVCNPDTEAFAQKAAAYFGTAPSLNGQTADIDCWVDAAGAPGILQDFYSLGKIESRFVSVAVDNRPRSLQLLQMTYAQQSVIGSGGYQVEDVQTVQRIMTDGRWDLERMITHEFALTDLEQALETAGDVHHAGTVIVRMTPPDAQKKASLAANHVRERRMVQKYFCPDSDSELTPDQRDGIAYVTQDFPKSWKEILLARYVQRRTLEQIAADRGISCERVRQIAIKGLNRLTGYEQSPYVLFGLRLWQQRAAQTQSRKRWPERSIDELHLSGRAHNCLMRAGYTTVGQVALARNKLCGIKNLGRHTTDEICAALDAYIREITHGSARLSGEE